MGKAHGRSKMPVFQLSWVQWLIIDSRDDFLVTVLSKLLRVLIMAS